MILPDCKKWLERHKGVSFVEIPSSTVNKYIQSAKFDGKILNTPWFTHKQLISGGKLELEMGPKPNKKWGVK